MTGASETRWRDRRVGDLVAEDFRRANVFMRFGIDVCCGGGNTVDAACRSAGVEYRDVALALSALTAEDETAVEPAGGDWDLRDLVAHIADVHHVYLRDGLPVLLRFSSKVARVHGERHRELKEIDRLVAELAAEMYRHMEDEERHVFPRIVAIAAGGEADAADGAASSSIREPIDALERARDHAGELIRRIRDLSDGFTAPADACATYRGLYERLEAFETDLHRHVHLENDILFPRALAMHGNGTGDPEARG